MDLRVAYPRVEPDPPVRAFYLANLGGGGPVNLYLLGHGARNSEDLVSHMRATSRACAGTI